MRCSAGREAADRGLSWVHAAPGRCVTPPGGAMRPAERRGCGSAAHPGGGEMGRPRYLEDEGLQGRALISSEPLGPSPQVQVQPNASEAPASRARGQSPRTGQEAPRARVGVGLGASARSGARRSAEITRLVPKWRRAEPASPQKRSGRSGRQGPGSRGNAKDPAPKARPVLSAE